MKATTFYSLDIEKITQPNHYLVIKIHNYKISSKPLKAVGDNM